MGNRNPTEVNGRKDEVRLMGGVDVCPDRASTAFVA